MKSRPFLLSILVISGITSAFAQTGTINCIVSDKITNDKIPCANVVVILNNNPASAKGTASDKGGGFTVENLPFGNYQAVISFIGYQSDTIKNITINRQIQLADIGSIELNSLAIALDEVAVQGLAKTASGKLDRITYRAADYETAKGGTAADVLSKLPSVSIDPEGVISVRGISDFMVYVNGKPTRLDPSMLLAQIPANTIESIDVIKLPSAKYDAQGKGGIINLSTKKPVKKGCRFLLMP
jgi:iron complex outermembrane receptor protein